MYFPCFLASVNNPALYKHSQCWESGNRGSKLRPNEVMAATSVLSGLKTVFANRWRLYQSVVPKSSSWRRVWKLQEFRKEMKTSEKVVCPVHTTFFIDIGCLDLARFLSAWIVDKLSKYLLNLPQKLTKTFLTRNNCNNRFHVKFRDP